MDGRPHLVYNLPSVNNGTNGYCLVTHMKKLPKAVCGGTTSSAVEPVIS